MRLIIKGGMNRVPMETPDFKLIRVENRRNELNWLRLINYSIDIGKKAEPKNDIWGQREEIPFTITSDVFKWRGIYSEGLFLEYFQGSKIIGFKIDNEIEIGNVSIIIESCEIIDDDKSVSLECMHKEELGDENLLAWPNPVKYQAVQVSGKNILFKVAANVDLFKAIQTVSKTFIASKIGQKRIFGRNALTWDEFEKYIPNGMCIPYGFERIQNYDLVKNTSKYDKIVEI